MVIIFAFLCFSLNFINSMALTFLYQKINRYLDLRKFGPTLHGGFGIGFDRLIQTMTGMLNIKDVSTFPRYPYHCSL